MRDKNTDAIIVAAGKGVRTGMGTRKQYIKINGLPLICYALKTFDKCKDINKIYLVVPKMEIEMCRFNFVTPLNLSDKIHIIGGGTTRQASVMNALKIISASNSNGYVLIHDAARPFVTEALVLECIQEVKKTGSCVPMIPVVDSLKKMIFSKSKGHSLKSIERKNMWLAQTPQAFDFKLIFEAYLKARKSNINCTDDSSIAEIANIPINTIYGLSYNIKVTTSEDFIIAKAIGKIMQAINFDKK